MFEAPLEIRPPGKQKKRRNKEKGKGGQKKKGKEQRELDKIHKRIRRFEKRSRRKIKKALKRGVFRTGALSPQLELFGPPQYEFFQKERKCRSLKSLPDSEKSQHVRGYPSPEIPFLPFEKLPEMHLWSLPRKKQAGG